jgi:hypothetical protein
MDEMLTDSAIIVKGLKIDELVITVAKGVILLKTLNSPSSRSFFFF